MIKLKELMVSRKFWKVDEAKKVVLKPKEVGEGTPVTVYVDDEGYLVLKDKEGKTIFLHPTQILQLKKFIQKIK